MNDFGTYLKKVRVKRHLSLKDVHQQCGVTDSKLSRLERGEGKLPDPHDLKKLAELYKISVIPLYIMVGYLNKEDLVDYTQVFQNADLLTKDEQENIQTQINLFTRGRKVPNNDI